LRKTQPDRYREIIAKQNQDPAKVVEEITRTVQFRSTVPEEVKFRVLGEYLDEWYCEVGCYPHLYFELKTEQSVGEIEQEQTVKIAQTECRGLLEDIMAHLGGRPATSPPNPESEFNRKLAEVDDADALGVYVTCRNCGARALKGTECPGCGITV
jgi:hypothetical protein